MRRLLEVSLHEHLMSTYEEEAQKERFQITDDSQANWAIDAWEHRWDGLLEQAETFADVAGDEPF